MRILIVGSGGLVGRAFTEHCLAEGDQVLAHDRAALDVSNPGQVNSVVERHQPEAIVNCAAWTDVDGCETDPRRANEVNALGPKNLAEASRRVGAVFLTISTDYVFDGIKEGFYTQRDNPNPQSVYAHSKLKGERLTMEEHARSIVVRTGFIFGAGGKNFLSSVVSRTKRGEELKVITDSWGTPTYSRHLARRLRELLEKDLPGIYHVVSSGKGATYEEFAVYALRRAGLQNTKLEPVSFESLGRPAKRPRNSRLKCLFSEMIGLSPLPTWEEGVDDFLGFRG